MKNTLFLAGLLIISACTNTSTTTGTAVSSSTTVVSSPKSSPFFSMLFRLTDSLNSVKRLDDEGVALAKFNGELIDGISKMKDAVLGERDSFNGAFSLAVAPDKQFAIVSWNTEMGGTAIDYDNMVVFQSGAGVIASHLKEEDERDLGMDFDSCWMVETAKKEKIYMVRGHGKGSSVMILSQVAALKIVNGKAVMAAVFPENTSSVNTWFDGRKLGENEDVPEIKIEEGGKKMSIPLSDDNGVFLKKWGVYIFDGVRFLRKK
jgi:hypothetical protein